jgi:hypothetical protein
MLDKRPIRGPWAALKRKVIGCCRLKSALRDVKQKLFVLRVVLRSV